MSGTSLRERFEKKYEPVTESGCWIWTASLGPTGYGQINYETRGRKYTKVMKAHRVAWLLYRGEIPSDTDVLHKCDQPLCVNPNHLFLGKAQDNVNDMWKKGRGCSGSAHPNSKLTEARVVEIRMDTRQQIVLAKEYGVSETTISVIKNGVTWKHV